jgi:hypothetical protein
MGCFPTQGSLESTITDRFGVEAGHEFAADGKQQHAACAITDRLGELI